MESCEAHLCKEEWAAARNSLAMVLERAPNSVHALYRYGLASLLGDAQLRARRALARIPPGVAAGSPATPSRSTTTALRGAIQLEPTNRALCKNVELALRIFTGGECDASMFSQAHAPKSSGDVRVLTQLALLFPRAATELAESKRLASAAAAESRMRGSPKAEV
jgi:hypothetical protein